MSTYNRVVSHPLLGLLRKYILVLKKEIYVNWRAYFRQSVQETFLKDSTYKIKYVDSITSRGLGHSSGNISYRPSGKDRNVTDPGTEPAPDNFLRRSLTTLLSSDQLFRITVVTDGVRSLPSLQVSIFFPFLPPFSTSYALKWQHSGTIMSDDFLKAIQYRRESLRNL